MRIGSLLKATETKAEGLHELDARELSELQKVLTCMLTDIAKVCEACDIPWTLTGGSALGCVRHGGFIPWDDDMDINMTRRAYEKFKQVFALYLSEEYVLKEPGDENYLMHYPQVYKKGTTAQTLQSTDKTKECVFIDIFILENTYDNKVRRFFHGLECTAYLFIDSVMRLERCKDNIMRYGSHNEKLCKEMRKRIFFSRFFKFRTLEKWLERSDKCFSKVGNDVSRYVVTPSGAKHFFGEIYEREKMCTIRKEKFSDTYFSLMEDSDYYLRMRYGDDYMTPPAEGDKEKHYYIKFSLGDENK